MATQTKPAKSKVVYEEATIRVSESGGKFLAAFLPLDSERFQHVLGEWPTLEEAISAARTVISTQKRRRVCGLGDIDEARKIRRQQEARL